MRTTGNKDVHIILRGANSGPNYKSEHVKAAAAAAEKARPDSHPSIMIDCSRASSYRVITLLARLTAGLSTQTDGNSSKNHNNQLLVLDDICEQIKAGERPIVGVMIESHINAGRQDIPPEGPQGLKYGVSITDACVDWETTVPMLDKLNEVSPSVGTLSLSLRSLTRFGYRL